jgi:hypothetical protein
MKPDKITSAPYELKFRDIITLSLIILLFTNILAQSYPTPLGELEGASQKPNILLIVLTI